MKQATTLIVIVIFLAIALGFVVGSPILQIYDPETRTKCHDGFIGEGQFPGAELLSTKTIYLSWTDRGTSIPFSSAWVPLPCGVGPTSVTLAWNLRFEISNGGDWELMAQDDFPLGETLNAGAARQFEIDGISFQNTEVKEEKIVDGALLRVSGIHSVYRIPTVFDLDGELSREAVITDQARLVYAIPTVTRGADIFEVGETGSFRWSVPFTDLDGRPAYYITIKHLDSGVALAGWDQKPLTSKDGTATFPVTADLFSTSGTNRVRASIYSPIFLADVEDVAVIDDKDLAPRITDVDLNQREFREGDSVEVVITATQNPTSKSPIVSYYVLAHIGGDIVYDQRTDSATISFLAPRTGVLEIEASAIDEAGRSSAIFEVQATVGNVIIECEVHPDLCDGDDIGGIPWALIAAAAFFVVGTLFVLPKARDPRIFLIMIIVLGVLSLGIYFLLGGKVPGGIA